MFTAVSMYAMSDFHSYNPTTAFPDAFNDNGFEFMSTIIYLGGFLGITATSISNFISLPRLFHKFSTDGLVFKVFSEISQKTNVPVKSTWILSAVLMIAIFFSDLNNLVDLTNLFVFLVSDIVCIIALTLRLRPIDKEG
mmetsp:Transcript_894/g.537  ORF Transcript_894/g.537 Transcript_894/m.537 type:complete len:139 (-) Transcript_894:404-820(-)